MALSPQTCRYAAVVALSAGCGVHVDALEGKIDLDAHWRKLVKANCQNIAEPKSCIKRELSKDTDPRAAEWKALYVASFGWSNCVAPHLKVNAEAARMTALRETLARELGAMVTLSEPKCEE